MMPHTSGPWSIGWTADQRQAVRNENDLLIAIVPMADDARLIVAAPELLEEALGVMKAAGDGELFNRLPYDLKCKLYRLKAAIAKARDAAPGWPPARLGEMS